MHSYLLGGVCLLFTYTAYYLLSSFLENRRHARNAAKLGCKSLPKRPYKLPFGIDMVLRIMKADEERRLPDMFIEVYEELGRPATWTQYFAGAETIVTADPKNIQAILATQFNDFALGKARQRNFLPMLGNGIFTLDGKGWYVHPRNKICS
jgi:hypothetical protein